MGATSVTGKGQGASDKPTLADLAIAAVGPVIMVADIFITAVVQNTSPPSSGGVIRFPSPLPGGADKYVISLTTHGGGNVYINELIENGDGDFTGFSIVVEAEGDVHYIVARKGYRPSDVR